MTTQTVFGRRNAPRRDGPPRRPVAAHNGAPTPPAVATPAVEISLPPQDNDASAQLDKELHAWRQARRQAYKLPWRQLTLMASLCFGVAALVLPDTISSGLDWLLYAMMAAGFYAGLRRRTSA